MTTDRAGPEGTIGRGDPYASWERQAIALLEEGCWEAEFTGERWLRMIDDRRAYNAHLLGQAPAKPVGSVSRSPDSPR